MTCSWGPDTFVEPDVQCAETAFLIQREEINLQVPGKDKGGVYLHNSRMKRKLIFLEQAGVHAGSDCQID